MEIIFLKRFGYSGTAKSEVQERPTVNLWKAQKEIEAFSKHVKE